MGGAQDCNRGCAPGSCGCCTNCHQVRPGLIPTVFKFGLCIDIEMANTKRSSWWLRLVERWTVTGRLRDFWDGKVNVEHAVWWWSFSCQVATACHSTLAPIHPFACSVQCMKNVGRHLYSTQLFVYMKCKASPWGEIYAVVDSPLPNAFPKLAERTHLCLAGSAAYKAIALWHPSAHMAWSLISFFETHCYRLLKLRLQWRRVIRQQ